MILSHLPLVSSETISQTLLTVGSSCHSWLNKQTENGAGTSEVGEPPPTRTSLGCNGVGDCLGISGEHGVNV